MTISNFLQKASRFEIQAYQPPRKPQDLKKTHVPFTGSPYKHPFDPEKVILVIDPYSSNTFYYEFNTQSVSFAEELSSIVTLEEETVPIVRLWVKKHSIAVRCSPFIVGDIKTAFKGDVAAG